MKKIVISILLLLSFLQLYAQRVDIDELAILSILRKEHKCQVSISEVSTLLSPSVRTFNSFKSLNINNQCVAIHYFVEHDSNGSSYNRLLLIPISLLKKSHFEKNDKVYYEDRWAGKGPHFDVQGGTYKANEVIRKLITYIKYSDTK